MTSVASARSSSTSITADEYYKNGLKMYLKRNYKGAADAWLESLRLDPENIRTRNYLQKAYDKYHQFMQYKNNGMMAFAEKDYEIAKSNFRGALKINPRSEDVRFYYLWCFQPKVYLTTDAPIISAKISTVTINIDYQREDALKQWVQSWELIIEDSKEHAIKKYSGKTEISQSVEWYAARMSSGEYTAKMYLHSPYDDLVTSPPLIMTIDRTKPKPEISVDKNMLTIKAPGEAGVVNFQLKVNEPSNVEKWTIKIYNDQNKLIHTINRSGNLPATFPWNGDLGDGAYINPFSTYTFKLEVTDLAGNNGISSPGKFDTRLFFDPNGFSVNINFAFGKATIQRSSFKILNDLAELIDIYFKDDKHNAIRIIGHTDDVGPEDSNLTLSENRARAVQRYFTSKHNLPKDRFIVIGRGESKPIAPNDTEENRYKNRRVEFKPIKD